MEAVTGRADLPDISALFSEAWSLYRERFGVLMALMAAGSAASLAAVALPLLVVLLWRGLHAGWVAWTCAATAGLSAGLWIAGWLQAALAEALLRPEEPASVCWRDSWPKVAAFTWVCVLYLLAVFGGLYFFILPGLYLAVALAFVPLVCVAQGRGGLACLRESLRLSEGRWSTVFGCLMAAGGASSLPGLVPVAGPVLSAAAAPFSLALVVVLYRHAGRTAAAQEPGPWARAALWAAPAGLLLAVWLAWQSVAAIRDNWPLFVESFRAALGPALEFVP